MAAMLIVVVGMTTLYVRRAPTAQGSPAVARLTVALPAGDRLGSLDRSAVALSPGGTRLVYVGIRDSNQRLYLRSLDELDSKAISGTEGATNPFFSPDGQWIGYFALGKLRKVSVAGGAVETVCEAGGGLGGTWGPDNSIYFAAGAFSGLWKVSGSGGIQSTGIDIWTLSPQNNRKPQIFLKTPSDEHSPQFSPDGRWLAYVSNESGRDDVYVQPFPGPGRRWPISTEGGSQPRWSRSGRELFYRGGDQVLAVDITGQPSFVAGSPRPLFEAPFVSYGESFISYDVAPDGRFLGIRDINPGSPTNQINVVLNWTEELKRRVPTR
jgi:eukaryotic-like serine/threonine-protein kinase